MLVCEPPFPVALSNCFIVPFHLRSVLSLVATTPTVYFFMMSRERHPSRFFFFGPLSFFPLRLYSGARPKSRSNSPFFVEQFFWTNGWRFFFLPFELPSFWCDSLTQRAYQAPLCLRTLFFSYPSSSIPSFLFGGSTHPLSPDEHRNSRLAAVSGE